jgi:hypothetical protein
MKATRRRRVFSKARSKKQRTRRKQHRRQKNTHKRKQRKRKQKKKTIRKRGGMPGAPAHAAGGQAKKARTVPSEETAIHLLDKLDEIIKRIEKKNANKEQLDEIENRFLKIKSVPISKDLDEEGNEVSVTMFDILEMLNQPYDKTIGYDVPELANEIIRKDIIPYIEGKSVLEPVEVLEIIIKKITNFEESLYQPYVSMSYIDPVSKEEVIDFMITLQKNIT